MFVNRATFPAKQQLKYSYLILFLFLLTKTKDYCIMFKKEKYERTFYKMTHEEKLEFLDRKWKATLSNEYWKEVERLAKLKGITYKNKRLFNDNISISLGTESKYTFLVYAEDNTFPFVDRYGIHKYMKPKELIKLFLKFEQNYSQRKALELEFENLLK